MNRLHLQKYNGKPEIGSIVINDSMQLAMVIPFSHPNKNFVMTTEGGTSTTIDEYYKPFILNTSGLIKIGDELLLEKGEIFLVENHQEAKVANMFDLKKNKIKMKPSEFTEMQIKALLTWDESNSLLDCKSF
jgi:hypothetical protein